MNGQFDVISEDKTHLYLPVNVIVSEVSMDSSRIILLLFLTLFIDISKENFIPERFGQVLEDEKNSGFSQTLLCYDNEFSGRSVMFTGYEPALGNVIFDNMYGRGQCEGDYKSNVQDQLVLLHWHLDSLLRGKL